MEKKKVNVFLILFILSIILILCMGSVGFVYYKKEEEKVGDLQKQISETVNTSIEEEPIDTDEEGISTDNSKFAKVKEYVNEICNGNMYVLPEFNDINEADKTWIYAKLFPVNYEDNVAYVKKDEIPGMLKYVFGGSLKVDVDSDSKLLKDMDYGYNTQNQRFEFNITDHMIQYIMMYNINSIDETESGYEVIVAEYGLNVYPTEDDAGKNIIMAYDENSENKMKEITRVDKTTEDEEFDYNNPDKSVTDEVLKRENEFRHFKLTIEEDDYGHLAVKKVEKI